MNDLSCRFPAGIRERSGWIHRIYHELLELHDLCLKRACICIAARHLMEVGIQRVYEWNEGEYALYHGISRSIEPPLSSTQM